MIVPLGVGQMGLGLAFLTIGARLIPAAEVALITLLEVVLGPALGLARLLGATQHTTVLVGGAIVVAAVAMQAGSEPHDAPSRAEPGAGAAHP